MECDKIGRLFRRPVRLVRVCTHEHLIQHFKGPVKPVYQCLDCNKVLVGKPEEKKEHD